MKELIQHPDAMRWIIWSWESQCDKNNWEYFLTSLLKTFAKTPIEIVITKNSLTIFKNIKLQIRSAPQSIKYYWDTMIKNKSEYFNTVEKNSIFKDIICKDCVLNKYFNRIIDRKAWVSWTCWWIINCNLYKIFVIKDMLTVALRNIKHVNLEERLDIEHLPPPPWISKTCKCKKAHDKNSVFLCIYNSLQQPIYNECISIYQSQRGYVYG